MDKFGQLVHSRAARSLVVMKLRSVTLVAKFALTLFIAKYIGFEALGQYGLITGISIMAPVILGLSLAQTICRKAVMQSTEQLVSSLRYYGLYICALYAAMLPFALAAGFLTGQLVPIITVFVIILCSNVNQDIYNLLLNLSRPFAANMLLFVRGALWIGAYVGAAFLWPELRTMEALLLSWIAGEAFALAGFVAVAKSWPWNKTVKDASLWQWVRHEFFQARTLYVNGIANTLSQYSDRYIITLLLGLELTGVYVLFWSISSALSNLVRTGVIQFSKPKLVRAHAEQSAFYRQLFQTCLKNTFIVSVMMALGAGLFMYFALPYLEKPLAVTWMPVLWLVLAAFVIAMLSEVYGLIFYSKHRDDITLKVSFFMLVTSVGFNFALVPFIGLWGTGAAFILVTGGALALQARYAGKLMSEDAV